MAKILLRQKAINLRLEGYTYSQIKQELGLQKSTLSDWLRNLPLTKEQLVMLSHNIDKSKELGREKYRATRQRKRLQRLQTVLNYQRKKVLPLSKKDLFLAGVFLYWGEGEKTHGKVTISNSDPKIVKFALYWMVNSLEIPREKIKVNLHLYKDMNIDESIRFWSEALNLPMEQFRKPYIKKTSREGLTYKSFGHGTCRLYYGSVALSEKIAMSIKAISDKYGAKSDLFWYN